MLVLGAVKSFNLMFLKNNLPGGPVRPRRPRIPLSPFSPLIYSSPFPLPTITGVEPPPILSPLGPITPRAPFSPKIYFRKKMFLLSFASSVIIDLPRSPGRPGGPISPIIPKNIIIEDQTSKIC